MKQLEEAISHKTNIVNKASTQVENDYYYTELVKVKTRTHVGPFRGEPKVSYHTEWRFKTDQYHKDLSDVDSQINQCLSELNQLEHTLGTLLENQETTTNKQYELGSAEASLKHTQHQLESTKYKIDSYVKNLSAEHRAVIYAEHIYKKDAAFLCSVILENGFNANILSHIGLSNGDSNILNIAIESGARLDSHFVEDKTLLQLIIQHGAKADITKAINAIKSFDHTLLNALQQNDIDSIKLILSHRPEIADHLIFEESTLLHHAIANANHELAQYLIKQYPQTLLKLNNHGENARQIAERLEDYTLLEFITSIIADESTSIIDQAVATDISANHLHSTDQEVELHGVWMSNTHEALI